MCFITIALYQNTGLKNYKIRLNHKSHNLEPRQEKNKMHPNNGNSNYAKIFSHQSQSDMDSINSINTIHMNPIGMAQNQYNCNSSNNSDYSRDLSQANYNLNSRSSMGVGVANRSFAVKPLKTPVSLLNEVCAKAKIVPVFEAVETGPPHDKLFECSVKLERHGMKWEGMGTAKTKKDSKQEAAKSLLLLMDDQVEKLLVPPKTSNEMESKPDLEHDVEVEGNPVGELNDMCLKIKRSPPEYEAVEEEGRPHERVYTLICKLGSDIVEQGKGRTKKQAKRVAAFKVKQRLNELIANAELVEPVKEEEEKSEILVEKLQSLALITSSGKKKKSKANNGENKQANKEEFKLADWFSKFRERSGEKMAFLKEGDKVISSTCPIKLLREISEEQKFKVEYLDVEKLEASEASVNELTCVVSIGIEPIAIFLGSGISKTQARKNAAARAVEFLKVAVNK